MGGEPDAAEESAADTTATDTAVPSHSDSAVPSDTPPHTDTAVPDPADTGSDATNDTTVPADTGIGIDDGAPIEPTPDYSVAGPWQAGVLTNSFSSDAATEHWVDVWYPATDFGTGPVEYYGGPTWTLDGDCYRDATPACTEPRPVMVHSHGSSSIRWELFPLMEHIISSGNQASIRQFQIQFHKFVENSVDRRIQISSALSETHERTWCYTFVWENWRKI